MDGTRKHHTEWGRPAGNGAQLQGPRQHLGRRRVHLHLLSFRAVDLIHAKVYVSILNSKNIQNTIEGLKKSSGFIRTELAKKINLRNTPELTFEIDDSMEYGAKIDSILKEILPE